MSSWREAIAERLDEVLAESIWMALFEKVGELVVMEELLQDLIQVTDEFCDGLLDGQEWLDQVPKHERFHHSNEL